MRITRILALLGLFASACGVSMPSAATPPVEGVAVGRVVCTQEGGTEVRTPIVRARRDGVHLSIHNRGEAVQIYMREARADANHGGRLRSRVTRDVSSHAPGEMWIVCLDRKEAGPSFYDKSDPRYATFEILDPAGLWVDFEPNCDKVEEAQRRFDSGTTVEDIEAWVRDRFDIEKGVRKRPGYPETEWKGDPWVIADEDTTFAYFHAFAQRRDGPLLAEAEGC